MRWLILSFYLVTILLAGFLWYFNSAFVQDDTYITLRYALNFINGEGLVWNPGERVEGYTNFLFLLLVSGLGCLGMDLLLAARLISFLAYIGVVALIFIYLRRYQKNWCDPSFAVPLCLALSNVSLIAWVYASLETILFSFLVLAVCLSVARILEEKKYSSQALIVTSILFALAVLTRPDGAIIFLVSFGFAAWFFWKQERKAFLSSCFQLVLPCALVVGAHLLWRHDYYSEWLPNTYYAKSYGIPFLEKLGNGLRYLVMGLIQAPFLLAFVIPLSVIALWKRKIPLEGIYVLTVAGIFTVYIVLAGGDFMFHSRFFVPVFCLSIVLLFWCFQALERKTMPAIIIMLFFTSLMQIGYYDSSADRFVEMDDAGRMMPLPPKREFLKMPPDPGSLTGPIIAEYINAHWEPGSLVTVETAGALPYFAPGFRFIDMLGLADKHIARRYADLDFSRKALLQNRAGHYKGDGAYVLSRRPDYIILGMNAGTSEETPLYRSDLEIIQHPDFARYYRKETRWVDVPEDLQQYMYAYNGLGITVTTKQGEKQVPYLLYSNKSRKLLFTYFKRISLGTP